MCNILSAQLFTYISRRDQAVQVINMNMIIYSDARKEKGQTLSRSGENLDMKVHHRGKTWKSWEQHAWKIMDELYWVYHR